ncbi:MAG: hypothetical protein PUB94_02440 [Oscillospiraceae bacterium]|nr:hypothetical protein [Oscillospiraceae bacterium]
MKERLLSIVLALVMLMTMLPLTAFAESTLPIVIVSGYSSSQIYEFNEDGTIKDKIWGLEVSKILAAIRNKIPDFTPDKLEITAEKQPEVLKQVLLSVVRDFLEIFALNPDGTPNYNTGTWPTDPAMSNMEYINANLESDPYISGAIHEKRYTPYLVERLGAANVYQFSCDWRMTAIECAFNLAKYVKAVKKYSGSSQVNIFSESHGGQVTGTYLSLCAIVDKGGDDASRLAALLGIEEASLKDYFDLGDVHNALMNSPAVGGVQLAYDFIKGGDQLNIDYQQILSFYEYANNPLHSVVGGNEYVWESEYEWLLGCVKLENFGKLLNDLIQNYALTAVLSLGSMWDFLALGYYDEIKASYLDTEEKALAYAPMIARSDYTHYVVMENLHENLTYAREHGVNVNIICGTDITTATGSQVNGDCLIAAKTASGAKTLDAGYRFNDGYKTDYTDSGVTCTDPSHDHVSPRLNLDAAYGYLPENTWYIEGQYHAQYAFDSYAFSLTNALLLDETIRDIYTSAKYPQFEVTYNAKLGLHAQFDNSLYGTLTKNDTALVVTNLSEKSNIEITGIKVEGMDITFDGAVGTTVKLGESVTLPFTGEVPDADMKNVKITIYFIEDETVCPLDSRTFNYVVRGGQKIEFDSENPVIKDGEDSQGWLQDIASRLDNYDLPTKLKAIVLSFVRLIKTLISACSALGAQAK